MSPVSEARKRANEKYTKANYDEIKVRVPKGKKKIIQQCAMNVGESTTAFINRAIDERIERDNAASGTTHTVSKTMDVCQEDKQETPERIPETPKKLEKLYKPFTESDEKQINFQELLKNIYYQMEVADAFGLEVLSHLLEKARQQESDNSSAE